MQGCMRCEALFGATEAGYDTSGVLSDLPLRPRIKHWTQREYHTGWAEMRLIPLLIAGATAMLPSLVCLNQELAQVKPLCGAWFHAAMVCGAQCFPSTMWGLCAQSCPCNLWFHTVGHRAGPLGASWPGRAMACALSCSWLQA